MEETMIIVVRVGICLALYVLSAYATTDILRLTTMGIDPVDRKVCRCSCCGGVIRLRDQIPIISFALAKGRCRMCNARIPAGEFFIELFLSLSMIMTVVLTGFGVEGYVISIVIYELTKLISILKYGKRAEAFESNLLKSFAGNVFLFMLLGILFLFEAIASVK